MVGNPSISHEEKLFLCVLRDLREKLANGDEYSLIKGSGLLRQLLLDEQRLVDQVNRIHKKKLLFRFFYSAGWNSTFPRPKLAFIDPGANGDPRIPIADKKLQEFLSSSCVFLSKRDVSIRDIISACANFKGGVHSGKPCDESQETIREVDKLVHVCDIPVTTFLLAGIIQVVIRAIEPLEDSIRLRLNPI